MDLSLNDEQKQIKALVRDFCKREVDQKRIHEILRQNDAAKTLDKESFIKVIQDLPYHSKHLRLQETPWQSF